MKQQSYLCIFYRGAVQIPTADFPIRSAAGPRTVSPSPPRGGLNGRKSMVSIFFTNEHFSKSRGIMV
jgi:hypothetical protein